MQICRWIQPLKHWREASYLTGNIPQRVSIRLQQKCFWTIKLDRNMDQRKNQAALEKSIGT
jgi:hypothetical protein